MIIFLWFYDLVATIHHKPPTLLNKKFYEEYVFGHFASKNTFHILIKCSIHCFLLKPETNGGIACKLQSPNAGRSGNSVTVKPLSQMAHDTTMAEVKTSTPGETDVISTLLPLPGNIVQPQGALFILYMILGATGIVGNTLSITVLATFQHMRKKLANVFLIHQSIIDLLTSVVLIANTLTLYQYHLGGIGGAILCVIWQNSYTLWSLYSVSTYNFCALSVELYISIVHPLKHSIICSRKNVKISMVMCWILGFAVNMFNPFVSGLIGKTCYRLYFWPNPLTRRIVGVGNVIIKFFIPLCLLAHAYIRILILIIQKISAPLVQHSSQPSQFSGAKRNTIKMLTIVCVCFILCWAWNSVYFLLLNLGISLSLATSFYQFTVIAVFSNCCVNPFIYATQYKEFRSGMKALFTRCLPKSIQIAASTGSHGHTESTV